ncbi:hypothetical protein AAFN90_00315 [Erwiniaceae bacterium CAU 1747]
MFSLFGLMLLLYSTYKNNKNPLLNFRMNVGSESYAASIIFVFLFFYGAIATILIQDVYVFEAVCFYPIFVLMVISSYNKELFLGKVFSLLKFSAWILLIVDVIQYLLFLFLNRLPALAYEGSVSVRFGSIQDDPNGYAFLLSSLFFIGYTYKGLKKTLFYSLLFINMVLTISFTGMASTILAITIVLLIAAPLSMSKLILGWVSLILFLIGGVFISQLTIVKNVLLTKQGSIEQHASLFSILNEVSFDDIIGLNPHGWVAESAYINFMLNFGVAVALITLVFVLILLFRYMKVIHGNRKYFYSLKQEPSYLIGLCALSHTLAVLIGGVNLPLEVVFPINALFPFFLGILSLTTGVLKSVSLGSEN